MLMDIHSNNNLKNMNWPVVGMVEWFRPGEHKRVEKAIAILKELGITELRTGISWTDYLTPEGKEWYNWLIPMLAKEVNVLPCFQHTPPSLGIVPRRTSPLTRPEDFANFLDEVITQLGASFEWVELWDEPNNKAEYDYTLDDNWHRFTEMIGKAAARAQHHGKKVILGGMYPVDPNWLQLLFDRGVMENIQAVGIHGFPEGNDQNGESWEENLNKVRLILKNNKSNAQIWITEAGFSTWQHDEYQQLQEFRNVLQTQVPKVYWSSLLDQDPELTATNNYYPNERACFFGLQRQDNSPKLLYRLLAQNGLNGLNKLTCITRQSNFNPTEKYALITGGWVLWALTWPNVYCRKASG
ncbi:hypothetical protein [Adhaeribacter swui]|uniref:hypothetical protein n=1 Tax=Adhaeribacter swui TaxID=2086471 RepID=UPI001E2A0616|nr:hypothetical protein [Adhaeribacter swui]